MMPLGNCHRSPSTSKNWSCISELLVFFSRKLYSSVVLLLPYSHILLFIYSLAGSCSSHTNSPSKELHLSPYVTSAYGKVNSFLFSSDFFFLLESSEFKYESNEKGEEGERPFPLKSLICQHRRHHRHNQRDGRTDSPAPFQRLFMESCKGGGIHPFEFVCSRLCFV